MGWEVILVATEVPRTHRVRGERKTRGEEIIIYRSYVITVLGTNGERQASYILLSRFLPQYVTSSEPVPA